MRTRQLLLGRANDMLSRDERKFVVGKYDGLRAPRLVMYIGVAGTGVDSHITGHFPYGGKQLKARHRRYGTVVKTSEHNTSQRCLTCFSPIVRPLVKVMVKGEMKTKSVQGSSICYNSNCSSDILGSNTKNRDVDAAVNIALAGNNHPVDGKHPSSILFDTSQYKTGKPKNCGPSVIDVSLIPATARLPWSGSNLVPKSQNIFDWAYCDKTRYDRMS